MNPTRKQRTELGRTLKQFAFEQSPMFQEGRIQSMSTEQTFEFINPVPSDIDIPGTLSFDQIKICLGFHATRFIGETGSKKPPVYSYEASMIGTQLIHPKQLILTDGVWSELRKKYLEDDEVEDDDTIGAEQEPDTTKEDITDALIDSGAECELYQKSLLTFATCEDAIESSYERGVLIESALFDEVGTHLYSDSDVEWEVCNTSEGVLYVPPQFSSDELSLGDEVEVRLEFDEMIRAFREDDRSSIDLLPHQDKLKEMLHMVDCLRRRRIPS